MNNKVEIMILDLYCQLLKTKKQKLQFYGPAEFLKFVYLEITLYFLVSVIKYTEKKIHVLFLLVFQLLNFVMHV